ncbi:enoyl-CoA hydratase/isomerase family protein [Pseudonocardia sp. WMMC193]|uniref:enoyl-CoA hydratase/isomerase family protein n=1 Tax=Pseudonocardia sp. WMMC193 TaxID=2911965 RepID=UPI001F00C9D1|nr:enoyl-CoA hydratase-related protein [Pseudonocardia sp. WMMC193]MCF7550796.1 enoyl-CoA hydratase-related protein [Pseudonocardia sp. WMMC193]
MAAPVVLVERPQPGVTLIRLNRPDQRNAVGWQTWEELGPALAALAADDTCRAVVLTGSGGSFCAGGDIKSSPSRGRGLGAPAARLLVGQRVLGDLLRLPQPVVAAVEGPAMGIGWSLALACDVVVAARDAVFGAPFVLRGLVPDGGAAWFLTRALGRQRASALLLRGGRMAASEAQEAGLVGLLTETGAALDEALALAAEMARGPAEALRLTKGMIRGANDLPLERFLELEWLSATLDITGPDAAEGRASFVEKRDPDFSALRDGAP